MNRKFVKTPTKRTRIVAHAQTRPVSNQEFIRYYLGQDGHVVGGLFIATGNLLNHLYQDDNMYYEDINYLLSKLEYLMDVPDLDYDVNKYKFAFKSDALSAEDLETLDDLDYYLNLVGYEVIS